MLINFKVKTLDAQTHELSVDNEMSVRELKDKIAEKTNIRPEQQRIIYCGRVLADERQIKEFDVDGKVLHVAERPPPSQGGPTSSSRANDNPPIRERTGLRGMRNSPLFRALDGMVVGSVSLPNNNAGRIVNPFASSSSFCMNRITVARHMLECANNIAAYLENPQRGLNNTSLDILQRGRWTMESTVVEVGISTADLPQSQNIVEMVQGAVTAALRGEQNTNVTVVQLPPVFDSGETSDSIDASDISPTQRPENSTQNSSDNRTATTVIIENVSDSDDEDAETIEADIIEVETIEEEETLDQDNHVLENLEVAANETTVTTPRTEPQTLALSSSSGENDNASTTTASSNSGPNDQSPGGARRRTAPGVLAEVIELWRNVQNRLNPFIQQFYDILQNEPTFEEGTNQRADAQRLFDRVSEAFHYMSHATHAISDLMLDFNLPTPRYLTCRPILVEQSGYISSNNFLTSTPILATAAGNRRAFQFQQRETQTNPRNVNSQATNTNITGNIATAGDNSARYDDPVDANPPTRIQPRQVTSTNVGTQSTDSSPIPMSRLIQAVVNSAPIDAEFHVQINTPIVSFGVPVTVASVHADPAPATTPRTNDNSQQQQQQSTNNTNDNQVRANTATLPTISTQTRPTSRPQVQLGATRLVPNSPVVHSFDRFLPCNSHHIRDLQNSGNNNNNARRNNNARPTTNARTNNVSATNSSSVSRSANSSPANVPFPRTRQGTTRSSSEPRNTVPRRGGNAVTLRNILSNLRSTISNFPNELSDEDPNRPDEEEADNEEEDEDSVGNAERNTYRTNLREQLQNFVNEQIFQGNPINDEHMPNAIERVIRWFTERLIFLPQYEKAEYDSRDSLTNILRQTLPLFFNLLSDPLDTAFEFERNLKHLFDQFMKRMYSVLFVCVGRANAELYWGQLMRLILVQVRINFRAEALEFLRVYINPTIPSTTPDVTDAQKFVVYREKKDNKTKAKTSNADDSSTDDNTTTENATDDAKEKAKDFKRPRPSNSDIDMTDVPSTSTSISFDCQSELRKTAPAAAATAEKINNSNKEKEVEKISEKSENSKRLSLKEKLRNAGIVGKTRNEIPPDVDLEEIQPAEPLEPLPTVEVGSEPWHAEFPVEWLPLITRDIQTMNQDQPAQPPFSDAYISGMAAKRRKFIQTTKPPTTAIGLLSENLRTVLQTVQNNNNSTSTNPNTTSTTNSNATNNAIEANINDITSTILSDTSVQASYTEAIRSSIRGRIRRDPDFDPSKYPGISKFLNKK